jgi:hypothetical protein
VGNVATTDRTGQRDPDMDVDFPRRCGFCVTEFGAPGPRTPFDLGDLRSLSADFPNQRRTSDRGNSTLPRKASCAPKSACSVGDISTFHNDDSVSVPESLTMSMSHGDEATLNRKSPLDIAEHMARSNAWPFERTDESEVTLLVRGKWADYRVSFSWMTGLEALHVACAFDVKVPERSQAEVQKLIALINARLWVGHFDLWPEDGIVLHRHSLVLSGGVEASKSQCEVLLSSALDACERYYPAFQFVVWAGEGAREAMEAAMFETAGQA